MTTSRRIFPSSLLCSLPLGCAWALPFMFAMFGSACIEINFTGYRCDAAHPCLDNFSCVNEQCIPDDDVGEGEGEAGEGEGEGEAGEGEGEAGEGEGEGEGVCGDSIEDAPAEECDDGAGNSDTLPNACRSTCTLPRCGDLVVDGAFGESCDDGNLDGTDGCSNDCVSQLCGNGELDANEECDNGEVDNNDELPDQCRTNCVNAFCGDGVKDSDETCDGGATCDANCNELVICGDNVIGTGETCDDGNSAAGDGCSSCIIEVCGDGATNDQPPEECDDGGTANGDGCTSTCTLEFCGDGTANDAPAEQCDDGNTISGDGCSGACVDEFCGDGTTQGALGEECDDGGNAPNDGCDALCILEPLPFCGDGDLDAGEECDNGTGNANAADTCRLNCRLPSCGDTIVDSGEQCDNGIANANVANACRTTCLNPRCGDTIQDNGEQCDDGNNAPNDGCNAICISEFCGDNITQTNEQCDDGNQVNGGDSCSNCQLPRCGDTFLDAGEECDDGNLVARDGCSPGCIDEIDEVEANNTPAQANAFLAVYGGRISPNNDQDCISVAAVVQDQITARMDDFGTTACETNAFDPTLTIFDIDQTTQVAFNDDFGGSTCAVANFIVPVSGTYYVCAESFANASTFVYQMRTTVAPSPCGNGAIDAGEQCDDGNAINGDGCTVTCTRESGAICLGAPSVCAFTCGNGVIDTGEVCDDAGLINGDGCSDFCAEETGFDCVGSPSVCDGICGDNLVRGTEQCDGGNLTIGDGCNALCRNEVFESEGNNSEGTADGPITTDDGFHGAVGANDIDMVRIDTAVAGTISITVQSTQACNGQRGMQFRFFNPGQFNAPTVQSTNCPATLNIANVAAGTHFFSVQATGSSGNGYNAAVLIP